MKTLISLLFLQSFFMHFEIIDNNNYCQSIYCVNEARWFIDISQIDDLKYMESLNIIDFESVEMEDEDYLYRFVECYYRYGKPELKMFAVSKNMYAFADKNKQ